MEESFLTLQLMQAFTGGSNLDNQNTAWFTSPAYSARILYFPLKGLAIIPSVQHQLIAGREAQYTSFDFGAYYEVPLSHSEGQGGALHLEAEYLRKHYSHDAFDDCNAFDAERHRLTACLTFHVANRYFPTDIRLNYEKYWYPHGGTPKESEWDKLVAELMIRF